MLQIFPLASWTILAFFRVDQQGGVHGGVIDDAAGAISRVGAGGAAIDGVDADARINRSARAVHGHDIETPLRDPVGRMEENRAPNTAPIPGTEHSADRDG